MVGQAGWRQDGGHGGGLAQAVLGSGGPFGDTGGAEAVGLGGQLDHAVPCYARRLEVAGSGHVQHLRPVSKGRRTQTECRSGQVI